MFENEKFRIGPTGAQKELFKMPSKSGKLRKGKRYELPEYFANFGLNAYEFQAGRMAKFSDSPDYSKFRDNTEKFDIALSIHAPYYISLTSPNPDIYEKSIERIANVYAWATWLNAKRIVLHPGSYGKEKNSPKKLIQKIIDGITRGIDLSYELFPKIKTKFKNICLCPETMGKLGQLGTTSEVIQICKSIGLNKARPCIDFGHLNARSLGTIKSEKLYKTTFNQIEDELGHEVIQNLHIHYSRIEFTKKGEKSHVPNTDIKWGPAISPLLNLIHEQGYTPTIINESPNLEVDAVRILKKWNIINN